MKLFCKHLWKSHVKKNYQWDEKRMIPGTEYWYKPVWETITYEEVKEVLICTECGKIKIIEY